MKRISVPFKKALKNKQLIVIFLIFQNLNQGGKTNFTRGFQKFGLTGNSSVLTKRADAIVM
jgi:hypothetical protein